MQETNLSPGDKPKVLFVDDEISVLNSLKRFSRKRSWIAHTASSAEDALDSLIENSFDVVVSDMRMPGMHGDEFLEKVKTLSPNTVRILLTGYSDMEAMQSVINHAKVYNYVTKPWDEATFDKIINEAIAHYHDLCANEDVLDHSVNQNKKLSKLALLLDKQVKERSMEVDQALGLLEGISQKAEKDFKDSLGVLKLVLEWKEGRDAGHLAFVTDYGVKIAKHLGLSQTDIDNTQLAGDLHRIGMLSLPDELRQRAVHSFNAEEKMLFQKHPEWGEIALSSSQNLASIGKIIRHHREYVNGTGFPDKLCDKEIPIVSKILLVVSDFYDVYNGRLEKNISGKDEAMEYINRWAGKRYDVEIVKALWEVLGDFGNNTVRKIELSSEKLAAGMNVQYDIVSENGSVLLTKGTVLTSAIIKKLVEFEKQYNEQLEVTVDMQDEIH